MNHEKHLVLTSYQHLIISTGRSRCPPHPQPGSEVALRGTQICDLSCSTCLLFQQLLQILLPSTTARIKGPALAMLSLAPYARDISRTHTRTHVHCLWGNAVAPLNPSLVMRQKTYVLKIFSYLRVLLCAAVSSHVPKTCSLARLETSKSHNTTWILHIYPRGHLYCSSNINAKRRRVYYN